MRFYLDMCAVFAKQNQQRVASIQKKLPQGKRGKPCKSAGVWGSRIAAPMHAMTKMDGVDQVWAASFVHVGLLQQLQTQVLRVMKVVPYKPKKSGKVGRFLSKKLFELMVVAVALYIINV